MITVTSSSDIPGKTQVSKDDSLPKYVCHRCLHKLEMCFEFQLSCIKSEAVLRHRINVEQNSAKSNKPRKAKAVSIEENEDEVQIIDSAEQSPQGIVYDGIDVKLSWEPTYDAFRAWAVPPPYGHKFVATDLDMHVERCDDSFGADDDDAKVDGLEDVAKRRETLLMDDAGGEAKSINTLLREAAESITEPTNPAQLSQTKKRLDKGAFALQR
ncbi:unnamed protein product [Timema podura]|uniref:ZAD domain-containing protein n=1 Tax=Timema podura TaxID=61482 RepID=A0ABN7NKA0_TIMPD|nr:unnamed protein product [Timema podura]